MTDASPRTPGPDRRRVLVTGAAGFVGAHVVRELAGAGHEVLAQVRSAGASPPADDARVRVVPLLLDDPGAVGRALQEFAPQVIVHLAWYARPHDYLESPQNLASLAATLGLVRAAVAAGCRRFVGVGTCLEYADLPRPRREHDSTAPVSLYASSKLAALLVSQALARGTAMRFAWARLFHLYGPGEPAARIVPSVAAALRARQPIALSPGTQVRDQLRVEDVAAALALLARCDVVGAVNVCSGRPEPLRSLLTRVADRLGGHELLRFGERPAPALEPALLVGLPETLSALGWAPRFDLDTGLAYLGGSAA